MKDRSVMNYITVCVCVCVWGGSVPDQCCILLTSVYLMPLCKQHKLLLDKMLFCLTHRRVQQSQTKWSINNDLWDEEGNVRSRMWNIQQSFHIQGWLRGSWIRYTAGYTHTDALYHPGDRSVHVSLSNTGWWGWEWGAHMLLHYGQRHQFSRKSNHPCLARCRLFRFWGKIGKSKTHTCIQKHKHKHLPMHNEVNKLTKSDACAAHVQTTHAHMLYFIWWNWSEGW